MEKEKSGKTYTIKKVKTISELEKAFKNGFIELFDECFNAAPYFLKYPDEELWDIYANHFKKGFVLFAYNNDDDNKIIGFAGSRPLADDEYVADDVKSFFPNVDDYWYHSDLGVSKAERGKGLAQKLIKESINQTPKNKKILMRTKENNISSIKLHGKMGFILLENVTQKIERKDSSGNDITDKRIYMIYDKN